MTIHRYFHPIMISLDTNPFVSQKEFSVDSSSFLTYCLSWYGMFCLKFSNCLQQPFPVGWFANLNHGNAIQRLVKWVEMDFEWAFLNITRVRLQWLASRAIWVYRVLCYLSLPTIWQIICWILYPPSFSCNFFAFIPIFVNKLR